MKENSIKIKDVLVINERFCSAFGVWPLSKTHVKFMITIIYCSLHLIMLYANLIDVLGNVEQHFDYLVENLLITVCFITMFIFRYNKSLARAILKVKNEMVNGKFENADEMCIYYNYNITSSALSKYMTYGAVVTALLVYMNPMTQFIQLYKDHGNVSAPLALPFQVKTFCDLTDYRIFILFYIYQILVPCIGFFHTSMACLVVILILHICGRLSVLSHRIRNIPWNSKERVESIIAGIVEGHLEIIRVERDIQDAFSLILLLDVGGCMLRLALLMYILLVSTNTANVTSFCTFLPYALVVLILLYLYCWVGEQLTHACRDVQDAYYHCNWQDIPNESKKSLIICMIYGQRALPLTAGGFYTFSLYGFTSIIKTCMAYVSMLRTLSTSNELDK